MNIPCLGAGRWTTGFTLIELLVAPSVLRAHNALAKQIDRVCSNKMASQRFSSANGVAIGSMSGVSRLPPEALGTWGFMSVGQLALPDSRP